MLVSEFLSKNENISKKVVTFVTAAQTPSIYKEKSVTEQKIDFCYYKPETLVNKGIEHKKEKFVTAVTVDKKFVTAETLINKGIEPYGNRSNRSNSKKTQNRFLTFEASVKRLEEEQSQGVLF